MAKTSAASCAVVFLALAACVHGLIPDALQCADGLIEAGLDELTELLTPCAFGPGETCCNGINPVFKLASGGFAEGCLCDELLLEELTKEITGNELAQSFGFTSEALLNTLQGCGTNFFGGTGDAWCPTKSQRINFSPNDIEETQQRQQQNGIFGFGFQGPFPRLRRFLIG